jgi:hypothetical protein
MSLEPANTQVVNRQQLTEPRHAAPGPSTAVHPPTPPPPPSCATLLLPTPRLCLLSSVVELPAGCCVAAWWPACLGSPSSTPALKQWETGETAHHRHQHAQQLLLLLPPLLLLLVPVPCGRAVLRCRRRCCRVRTLWVSGGCIRGHGVEYIQGTFLELMLGYACGVEHATMRPGKLCAASGCVVTLLLLHCLGCVDVLCGCCCCCCRWPDCASAAGDRQPAAHQGCGQAPRGSGGGVRGGVLQGAGWDAVLAVLCRLSAAHMLS